jgi:hypothetical protein
MPTKVEEVVIEGDDLILGLRKVLARGRRRKLINVPRALVRELDPDEEIASDCLQGYIRGSGYDILHTQGNNGNISVSCIRRRNYRHA